MMKNPQSNRSLASTSRRPRLGARIAAALAFAVLAGTGLAQVQQIPQGKVLDANPQVGSGGSNTPVPGYTPINGNAIIYGQVNGLASFHGTVGSSSPDVFQGNLPSASLGNFARQSAGGIPATAGATPAQYYVLPSTLVSGSQGTLYATPIGSGFDSRLLPATSVSPTAPTYSSSAMLGAIPSQPVDRNPALAPTDSSTTPGSLLSSPLFFSRQAVPEPTPSLLMQPSTLQKPETPQTANPQDQNKVPDESSDSARSAGGVSSRIDTRVRGRPEFTVTPTTPEPGTLAEGTPTTNEPRDLGSRAIVSKTYTELLAELRKAQALEDAATQQANRAGATTAPAGAASAAGTNPAGTAPVAPGSAAVRRYGGGPGGRSITTMAPLLDEPASVLRAGQHVEPLKTLAGAPAGGRPTPFDQQMKHGEELLKAGKYLEAVDLYQQALGVQPENALAVIGKAHAELAAGMYTSAAYDLKSAFARQPQLVSVRYALEDFIPPRRLNMVFTDLLALTTQDRPGDTASFLYCYVAYNTGHEEELKKELARWEIRAGHDTWQSVAAKAWAK